MGYLCCFEDVVEMLVCQGMMLVLEKCELFVEMSVEDNLLFGVFDCYCSGYCDQMDMMDEVFEFFLCFEEWCDQLVGMLFGGEC